MNVKSKNSKVKNVLNVQVLLLISLCLCVSVVKLKAQTGGTFDLSHNVIASGGDSNSTGGNFTVSGTVGQNSAGTVSSGNNFSLRGGFWTFDSLAPTAAQVSVSGKVTTVTGNGIRNVRITLTDGNGVSRIAQTGSLGYFRFEEVAVGEIYILEVSSKKFFFSNPTRVLSVQNEIADAGFIAEPW